LLNTHLHSDHCGGNAALQQAYPGVATHIPPGLAQAVADWDPVALTFQPTGQDCPPFRHDALLQPGSSVRLGACDWEVHAAKGHDPHAVLLFQAEHRLLLSADALWEHGFGVVFPELEGVDAFDEVADTLDLIERLDPVTVVPGHGRVFQDVAAALQRARSRLNKFVTDPASHLRHGYKVLIKFKLLEWRQMELDALYRWCEQTPYLRAALQKQGGDPVAQRRWLDGLLADLARSQALRIENGQVFNT
ncbi:MBL fold metallo-hydrolase, partial [Hydrogenophaga sp.]|uniref:MBL fold metallo-hydrolase n=1 Tax=Hydrogenophaga sp. TaxID=1904254 RepID=UPI003565C97E